MRADREAGYGAIQNSDGICHSMSAAKPFRIARLAGYNYVVYVGGREVAEICVRRCTARTQDYLVRMSHNGDVIFPFSSVRKAAEAAVRHMPPVLDYQI